MSKFWKTLVGAAVLVGGASSIAIADGYEPIGKGFVAPQPYNWTGFYFGLNAGFGVGDTTDKITNLDPNGNIPLLDDGVPLRSEYEMSGAIYGGQLGYNWQTGDTVFGIEATFNGSDIDGADTVCAFTTNVFDEFASCDREVDWWGTIAGRLGYAVNHTLLYVKGGWAYGKVDTAISIQQEDRDPIASLSGDKTHTGGWVAGVGLEHAFTRYFSAGVEYSHIDLGSTDQDLRVTDTSGAGADFTISDKVDVEFDTIKLRANWKLGGF